MKKTISIITSFLLLITFFNFFISTQSYAESTSASDVKVLVNNKLIDFPDAKPFINENDRILVPVRFISETLGATVTWNGEIKQVDIMGMDKQIKLNIGQSEALINEEKVILDAEAIMKDGRTFVPLRFISEALGGTVTWDVESLTVYINTEIQRSEPSKIDKEKVIEELEKYPTDYTNEYKDIKRANKQTIKILGEETSKNYEDAKRVIELLYNRDYREVSEDYKNKLLYYFHGWQSYKGKKYTPEELIDKWIEHTKADKIIQQAILTTDPSLVYITENDGGIKVRGRLFLNYINHQNIENVNLELEKSNKINLEIGKWYEADVDILLNCPVTNAPRPEGSKHAEWVYKTIRYLSDFKEVK